MRHLHVNLKELKNYVLEETQHLENITLLYEHTNTCLYLEGNDVNDSGRVNQEQLKLLYPIFRWYGTGVGFFPIQDDLASLELNTLLGLGYIVIILSECNYFQNSSKDELLEHCYYIKNILTDYNKDYNFLYYYGVTIINL